MKTLLKVENLDISFSGYGITHQVLHDVNFTVGEGEQVSLIGETGSGKSVTSKAILGTLPNNASIDGGRISFEGVDLFNLPATDRERLKGTAFSIIMQDPLSSFNPVFRIGTHLEDVMYHADRRQGIIESAKARKARIFDTLRKCNWLIQNAFIMHGRLSCLVECVNVF